MWTRDEYVSFLEKHFPLDDWCPGGYMVDDDGYKGDDDGFVEFMEDVLRNVIHKVIEPLYVDALRERLIFYWTIAWTMRGTTRDIAGIIDTEIENGIRWENNLQRGGGV